MLKLFQDTFIVLAVRIQKLKEQITKNSRNSGIFVAGDSNAVWGVPLSAYIDIDAFVANLDSSGVLIQHIFLGEYWYDYASGIAVNGDGYGYVAVWSEAKWGVPIRSFEGNIDGFVANQDVPHITICYIKCSR